MNDVEIAIKVKDMTAEGTKGAAGNLDKVSKSIDNTSEAAGHLDTKMRSSSSAAEEHAGKLDRVGEAADSGDTKMMGLADGITGVGDLMKGPGKMGAAGFAMALSDIGSSVFNFVIPTLQMLSVEMIKNGVSMVTNAASTVASAATSAAAWVASGATTVASMAVSAASVVAGWIAMGIAALASAAQVAIAWLIAMGPAVLVVAAIIAVIVILVKNWDTVKAVALAVWEAIWNAMKSVWNWISSNWPLLLAILTGPFGLAVLAIIRNWDTIKSVIGAVLGWIGDRIAWVRDTIINGFMGVVNFVTSMPGRIASAASGMFNGIVNAFKSAINGLLSLWNNISFTLPKINIPSLDIPGIGKIGGGSFGGQTFGTPNIPYLASGGTRSGRVIVGEYGPEMVDLGASGHVTPAGATRAALAGGGGGGVTHNHFHIAGSILSERQLIQIINDAAVQGRIPGVSVS